MSRNPNSPEASSSRQAAVTHDRPLVIHDNTVVRLEIIPRETLHIDESLIDGINAMEKGPIRSALKAVIKILRNSHGEYPASYVRRMPDDPALAPANGNRGARFLFKDAAMPVLKHAPKETDHFYVEVNQDNKVCFISVRTKDNEVICNYPPDGMPATATKRSISPDAVTSAPKRQEIEVASSSAPAHADADGKMKAAWDTWRVELAEAKRASGEERKKKMADARRNFLNVLVSIDSEPWEKWNIPGVWFNDECERWDARIKINKKPEGDFIYVKPDRDKVACWIDGVILTQEILDWKKPPRFGEGDWEPPFNLAGLSVRKNRPRTWIAQFKAPQEEKPWEKPFTFKLDVNGDKERAWNEARKTRDSMVAGEYEHNPK